MKQKREIIDGKEYTTWTFGDRAERSLDEIKKDALIGVDMFVRNVSKARTRERIASGPIEERDFGEGIAQLQLTAEDIQNVLKGLPSDADRAVFLTELKQCVRKATLLNVASFWMFPSPPDLQKEVDSISQEVYDALLNQTIPQDTKNHQSVSQDLREKNLETYRRLLGL